MGKQGLPVSKSIAAASCLIIIMAAIAFFAQRPTLFFSETARTLTLQNTVFQVEEVKSEGDRRTGLSGLERLPKDGAMLFVFDAPGRHCIWMKDMRFALDIVWLDSDKRVIHIKENAAPASYPERFCPDRPAQYVLELNAGTITDYDVTTGQQLDF